MPSEDDVPTGTATSVDPALDDTVVSPGGGDLALTTGKRIGRYELQDELGRGGMGVVFRARDPQLDRPLAIKIVLPLAAGNRTQQRLLDEARAMAKLRHPAVVPVFDVGTTERGVYIVMPLVSGGTMHDWLRAERRTWRQVLDRYLVAGRGLAAAHDAGLVHRDFKPRNVLVSDKGEVLVADFGIAARTDATADGTSATPDVEVSSISGTPAYMAPEQAQGQTVDARADQFSFCISLWEGLNGERPAEAETRTQGAFTSSQVPPVPTDRRGAPGWLLAAIARGFSPAPERRWPSVAALLDHVERRLRRPRRIALAAAAVSVLGVAAAVVMFAPAKAPDPCPDPRGRIQTAWSPAIRKRLEAAFTATGLPFAADTFARLAPELDAYAETWRGRHIEVCRAARVEHNQSAELFDRRMACFDRNLAALRAQTDLLLAPTPAIVRRALDAAQRLPGVDSCVDGALANTIPLPTSPVERSRIRDLDDRIMAARAAGLRGEPSELLRASEPLVAEARALAYAPSLARALENDYQARRANKLAADQVLRELADTSARARDDNTLALAWTYLILDLAQQSRFSEATPLEHVARATVSRAGSQQLLRYQLESALGSLHMLRGDFAAAEPHIRQALELAENPFQRRASLVTLASILVTVRRMPEGLTIAQQAAELTSKTYGARHPESAAVLIPLAQAFSLSGNPEDVTRALDALQRSLDIRLAAFGENHIEVAQSLGELANVEIGVGRYAEAEQHARRAVAISEQGTGDPRLTVHLQTLAGAIASQDRLAEARPYYERAMDAAEKIGGKDNERYVGAEVSLANRLLELGDVPAARTRATHAAAVFERLKIKAGLALALRTLAMCDIKDGKPDAAIATLDRAVELCRTPGCRPGNLEALMYTLGEQLILTGTDRARGLKVLKETRAGLLALGRTDDVKELDAWLKNHGQRRK